MNERKRKRREWLRIVREEGITPFRNRKSLKRRRLSIKG
jgi:hypothetical protein